MDEAELVSIVAAILRAGQFAGHDEDVQAIPENVSEALAIISEAKAQLARQKENPPPSNLRTLRKPSS
jgi:hypothetical protein